MTMFRQTWTMFPDMFRLSSAQISPRRNGPNAASKTDFFGRAVLRAKSGRFSMQDSAYQAAMVVPDSLWRVYFRILIDRFLNDFLCDVRNWNIHYLRPPWARREFLCFCHFTFLPSASRLTAKGAGTTSQFPPCSAIKLPITRERREISLWWVKLYGAIS